MKKLIILLLLTCFGFSQAQTIKSKNQRTTGYIKNDGTVQNSNHATFGYLKSDGTVQDRNHSTLGYLKDDDTIQDRNHSTIGYANGVSEEWIAVKFFFFK